ncbi:MAG: succinate dehydrogenase, hydrophobic membrane anchor protein [Candidatus Thiodiazotropha sp.]
MNHHLSGLSAWLVQRLSAVYMALFSVTVLLWWFSTPAPDFAAWRGLFARPLVGVAVAMFFLALLLHAWVGIRDVILDYAGRLPGLRLFLLALLGGWLIAEGFWILRILLAGMAL